MKKLFANKKKRYLNLTLVILPFIILIILGCFIAYKSISNVTSGETSEKVASIDNYDYHLRADATDLQKELFTELTNDLTASERDDIKCAADVGKNFVADFYTWSNKAGQYDVGGLFYVYSPQKRTIYQQARDSFYHYLSTYIDEYGSKNLLEVNSIEAKASKIVEGFTVDEGTMDAYYVQVTWTYKDSDVFPTDNYEKSCYLTIIKNNDGRFEIVEAYS